ncbi:MAG: glycine cleavage system protein H [Flavobacteriales bacterium]|nr:glycine cleavage system protein H [Flavobacteriales bacterium]
MEILDNLQYTKNHEWVLINGAIATIGVTDYAQRELGDIVYVDVDTLDQELNIDDVFGSVEAVKTVSDLYMPVAGKIIEINKELENSPELLNKSPYKDGWIVKVQLLDTAINNELLSSSQYKTLIGI